MGVGRKREYIFSSLLPLLLKPLTCQPSAFIHVFVFRGSIEGGPLLVTPTRGTCLPASILAPYFNPLISVPGVIESGGPGHLLQRIRSPFLIREPSIVPLNTHSWLLLTSVTLTGSYLVPLLCPGSPLPSPVLPCLWYPLLYFLPLLRCAHIFF